MLKAAGRPVQIGGNIGRGVLDLDPAADGMVVVLELSSYQIELARALQPDIAVFLNLSPDHLDRHGGMGGYFAAKRRLFTQGGPSRSIIGVDENEGRFLANAMREEAGTGDPVIEVSVTRKLAGAGWHVIARKGFLAEWRHGRQVASIDLRAMLTLPGRPQPPERLRRLCRRAQPRARAAADRGGARELPRPRRTAASSSPPGRASASSTTRKATNADAAEKALLSFERIRWIAGGRPKEGGIEALRPLFPRVAKAYLIGEAAEDFAATLGDDAARRRAARWTRRWRRRSPRRRRARSCCSRRPAPASTSSRASRSAARAFEALVKARIGG